MSVQWLPCCRWLRGIKWRGCSSRGADQRSLHLFGSRSEMSSVSHYASGIAGEAQPEVYEKQRERRDQEGGNSEGRGGGEVMEREGEEKNELADMRRQRER